MKESDLISLKENISKINLDSETAYEEIFCVFTQGFNMPIITIPFKKGSFGFRSRNNIDLKDFCSFDELSYPDKEYLTNYSRANKPGQQMFYCSADFETNIKELSPFWSNDLKIGEKFAITTGTWNFMERFKVCVIPNFDNEKLSALLNRLSELKKDPVLLEYFAYVNSFFSAQGFYQPNIYKFTSAYSNAYIHNSQVIGEDVKGILYTSIQNTSGWNLALSPKFVDDNFELKSVFKLILRKREILNSEPAYDNFLDPVPIIPKMLDYSSDKIIW